MRFLLLFLLSLSALGCVKTTEPAPYVMKGALTEVLSLKSQATGIAYPVSVYTPEHYERSEARLPVIYALDGQWCFETYAKVLDERSIDAIVVAVSQGPDDRRFTDYSFKGNRQYLKFLESELLPFIESNYRVDTSRRTITGTSLGGTLVTYALVASEQFSDDFANIIAIDTALRARDRDGSPLVDLDQYREILDLNKPKWDADSPTLYITNSSVSGLLPLNRELVSLLVADGYPQQNIVHKVYPEDHFSVNYPSFVDAVEEIYSYNQ